MGNWSLITYLGTAAAGALAFLRLVSNEIHIVEKEAAFLHRKELSKKRRIEEKKMLLAEEAA